MLLSVIIPSVGREQVLESINSCLRQELPKSAGMEILLVDNTPDGRLRTMPVTADSRIRWIHEPKAGVAHARNTGVNAARGAFIAFLDDDEFAHAAWAETLIKKAESGRQAVFGPVLPLFAMPPGALEAAALRLYRRDFSVPDDTDITDRAAHVGTGNSMFHRSCFSSAQPFSVVLGELGGEDSAFIQSLVQRNIRLTWAAHALVTETVPAERLTFANMRTRHFRQGQIRSIVQFMSPGLSKARGVMWMVLGLGQFLVHGTLALSLGLFGLQRAQMSALKCMSGLGKICWQRRFRRRHYGSTTHASTSHTF